MNWDPGLRSDGREARGEWWISESTAVKISEDIVRREEGFEMQERKVWI